jgi:hypothetical protein
MMKGFRRKSLWSNQDSTPTFVQGVEGKHAEKKIAGSLAEIRTQELTQKVWDFANEY